MDAERVSMSDDYFSLLNLSETKFDIDPSLLEKNYIEIQAHFHPDRFFSIQDKEAAVRHMAKVNEAYLVLKSPMKRAEYLLKKDGIKISEADRSRIVEEVLDFEVGSSGLSEEISACVAGIESSFSEGNVYRAAVLTEKLKYLGKIKRSGSAI